MWFAPSKPHAEIWSQCSCVERFWDCSKVMNSLRDTTTFLMAEVHSEGENSLLRTWIVLKCVRPLCPPLAIMYLHLLLCYVGAFWYSRRPSPETKQMPAPCSWTSQSPAWWGKQTSLLYKLSSLKHFVIAIENRLRQLLFSPDLYTTNEHHIHTISMCGVKDIVFQVPHGGL